MKTDLKPMVLEAYIKTGTITGASLVTKVHRDTIYEWLDTDPKFRADVEKAKRAVVDMLETPALAMARRGNVELMKFFLKAFDPEKYGDRVKHDHTVTVEFVNRFIVEVVNVLQRHVPAEIKPKILAELDELSRRLEKA